MKNPPTSGSLPVRTRRTGTSAGRMPRRRCSTCIDLRDFGDSESQRVFTAAAQGVARELGRQAAREYFAETVGKRKVAF